MATSSGRIGSERRIAMLGVVGILVLFGVAVAVGKRPITRVAMPIGQASAGPIKITAETTNSPHAPWPWVKVRAWVPASWTEAEIRVEQLKDSKVVGSGSSIQSGPKLELTSGKQGDHFRVVVTRMRRGYEEIELRDFDVLRVNQQYLLDPGKPVEFRLPSGAVVRFLRPNLKRKPGGEMLDSLRVEFMISPPRRGAILTKSPAQVSPPRPVTLALSSPKGSSGYPPLPEGSANPTSSERTHVEFDWPSGKTGRVKSLKLQLVHRVDLETYSCELLPS